MSDPYLGEIKLFSYNRVPRGWAVCNGQTLQIIQNQALYSLIANAYGGDGRTTFALPDLRGRVVVGATSTDKSLSYGVGYAGGLASVPLTLETTPQHNHTLNVSTQPGNTSGVANGVYGSPQTPSPQDIYAAPSTPLVPLASNSLQPTGGGEAHNNMQPYMALQYCIAISGIYPYRP